MTCHRSLVVAVAAVLFAACSGNSPASDRDAQACVEQRKDIPVQISRDIDVLLVVDTSPSMAGEASRLATNVGRFANVLENIEGGLPNIHIGVVSADVAARNGQLEATPQVPGCSPPDDPYLSDIAFANGERDANYTGSFADALACIATLPVSTGDIEEPFEAVRRALSGDALGNAGFLREDAFLMVVFIGDDDDCSGGAPFSLGEAEDRSAWRCFEDSIECDQAADTAGAKTNCAPRPLPAVTAPVADYVDFLRAVKPDPSMVIVAAVTTDPADPVVSLASGAPTLDPACETDTAQGRPTPRMHALLDAFPQRNAAASVCDEDWSDAMALLAELARVVLVAPCLDGDIDLDLDADGIQHDCTVSQVRFEGDRIVEDIVLDECSSADPPDTERPCFVIDTDPLVCPDTPTSATLEVLRGRENVPAGTVIQARCFAGCR